MRSFTFPIRLQGHRFWIHSLRNLKVSLDNNGRQPRLPNKLRASCMDICRVKVTPFPTVIWQCRSTVLRAPVIIGATFVRLLLRVCNKLPLSPCGRAKEYISNYNQMSSQWKVPQLLKSTLSSANGRTWTLIARLAIQCYWALHSSITSSICRGDIEQLHSSSTTLLSHNAVIRSDMAFRSPAGES